MFGNFNQSFGKSGIMVAENNGNMPTNPDNMGVYEFCLITHWNNFEFFHHV